MSTWSIEKQLLLGMELQQKRLQYIVKSYLPVEQLPVWKETAKAAQPTLSIHKEHPLYKSTKLQPTLNSQLAAKVAIFKGDMTTLEIDAIVNAANSKLKGGGGVDGFIHRGAGPHLLEECQSIAGGCPTGEARMTGGYRLPAKYVIHTVGPTDKSESKLTNCYKSCFSLLTVHNIKSVAFPCIATGIYGFPNETAAHIACRETRLFLEKNIVEDGGSIEKVVFCTFEPKDFNIYNSVAQLYFPVE